VLNKRGKFCAKIFSHYEDITIFVLGYCNMNQSIYASVHWNVRVVAVGRQLLYWQWLSSKAPAKNSFCDSCSL